MAAVTVLAGAVAATTGPTATVEAQGPAQTDPNVFSELRWRNIGPHRASRTKALDGVAGQPHTFYIGVVNGGVWKTTDAGRTWVPIFDDQPTGSIGALAVAPSDPNVIYVGTGEAQQRPDLATGDGMYKSTDAGRTWTHLGLRDTQQIAQVVVDPKNADRVFVAALGHPYGPNTERGIFRSLDGGRTFERVLYRDENTGGVDVVIDPVTPSTVYASLWQARQGPWENGDFRGPGSGLFKSTDGGTTWRPLSEGLPTWDSERLGRIGIGIAPSQPSRLFLVVEARTTSGIYRSDDAGETWTRVNADERVVARPSDATDIRVHPTNPDIVYVPTIVTWKSTDGGRTFTAIRGAPGGDDYQRAWINPTNPDIIAMTSDQGAVVTLNGGETWSSWYNQPTAAFYHVTTDNAFPYRVCSGQQESGSVCISSRGDHGQITFREWSPVGVEEYGYVAPDPLDPDIVYGGKVSRWDRRTGQVQNVGPRPLRDGGYRVVRTMPVLFSPVNPRKLFFSSNVLWQTTTGGQSWDQISPDLTRPSWEVPANVGIYSNRPEARPTQRGVIYTIAPSYLDEQTIWVGTDDGRVWVTRDAGASWGEATEKITDLGTPADFWVSRVLASRFEEGTAYVCKSGFRADDSRPFLFKTSDFGQTWTSISTGLPPSPLNVIVQDLRNSRLLFVGNDLGVYVTFDGGNEWLRLKNNLPSVPVKDLVIHPRENDLVVATYGRGLFVVDISPLQQVDERALKADMYFFQVEPKPQLITRNFGNYHLYGDRHIVVPNEPDGLVINYFLSKELKEKVKLVITDALGTEIDTFETTAKAGMNRIIWPMTPKFTDADRERLRNARWEFAYLVEPGEYRVCLEIGKTKLVQKALITKRIGWTIGPVPVPLKFSR